MTDSRDSRKAEMQASFVTLGDGCRIAYRLDGPPDAPVLLLSNSLGTNLAMWEPQLPRFTQRFRVLRYDSRGHGQSAAPPGAYSLDRLGRDAVELLESLGIERVHFCGLSKGGMVGQWLGYRHPECVDRLVLANTAAFMGPPSAWQRRMDVVSRQGMSAVADAVVERWFTPAYRAHQPGRVAQIREMLLATPPSGYAGCCAAIRDMDLRPTSRLISRPTLVIAGRRDLAIPILNAKDLVSLIPGAALVALDAAHLSNVEQPGAFTRAVLDFLIRDEA